MAVAARRLGHHGAVRRISRRAAIVSGAGLAAAALAAAGGYELVQDGALPGKYRLAEALGQCGAAPPPPPGPGPVRETVTFWSSYRKQMVRMVTLIPQSAAVRPAQGAPPSAAARGAGLEVVIALHGLGGNAVSAADLYAPAMTQAGARFAVVAADGGSTYWHKRADGDDPLGMVVHEILPRAAAHGLAVERIGIIGYSMGGYGALLLAERLSADGPRPTAATAASAAAAAVAAASPAIFTSYQDASSADSRSFAGPAEFARYDVLAGLAALRRVPAWVSCGSDDPFEAATELARDRLGRLTGRPVAGGITSGCHDDAFWARTAPSALEFLGLHLTR
jgi:S-formylglutathione hydrolase FrmB